MSRRGARALAAAALCAGCLAPVRVPSPPGDPAERRRAELGACQQGALPQWLDDAALSTAAQVDRGEAQAGALNDSFLTDSAAAMARPPPGGVGGSRVAAILAERRAFEEQCLALRSAGRDLVPGAARR